MRSVKPILCLLCLLALALILPAQPAPEPKTGSAVQTNGATSVGSLTNREAELRRRLRQRMTNPSPEAAAPALPASGPATLPLPSPNPPPAPAAVAGAAAPSTNLSLPALPPPGGPRSVQSSNAIAAAASSAVATNNLAATPGTNAPAGPPAFPTFPEPRPRPASARSNTNRIALPVPGGAPAAPAAAGTGQPTISPLQPPPATAPARVGASTNAPSNALNTIAPGLNPDDQMPGGTLKLQVAPLEQVMDLYGEITGRTIIRSAQLPAPPGFTLKAQTDLTRREAVEALDGVLALNGIVMIPIGEKFVKAVPATAADKEGAAISHLNVAELPESEQFLTRIVKLKTAKPSEVAQLLVSFSKSPTGVTPIDSNNTLVLRDFASNVKRMLEIIEKVDVTAESDFKLEVIPIRYGKVTDIYATMSALISGTGGGAAGSSARPAGSFGATGASGGFGGSRGGSRGGFGQFGGSSGYGGYGGGGYRSGGGVGGYNQYYPQALDTQAQGNDGKFFPQQVAGASAAGNQGAFQQRLNQIVNKAATGNKEEVKLLESANIVPDERSNKLLIFANKRDMEMITNLVGKVDVLLAQVLIEAIILEVKLGDSMKFGVSFAQQPKKFGQDFTGAGVVNNSQSFLGSVTNFPGGAPGGFSYYGAIGNNLDVAMNAIATDDSINIVSRPRIQTSHAIPGFFFIGETVPYITGFSDYGGIIGSGVSTRSTINEKEIGLNLSVTPFITPEGLVVMEIQQKFDQRGKDVLIDGNPVPLVNSREANSTLTVRNGDTIMLGGFISENKSKSSSGVPFLKDIPGLGALFRNRSTSDDRTELIILMKASVLKSPEDAAIMAESEQSQLPGVRAADRAFKEGEAKRLKKAKAKEKNR